MFAEDLQLIRLAFQGDEGYTAFDPVSGNAVGDPSESAQMGRHQFPQYGIRIIINEHTAGFDPVQEDRKLLEIVVKRRENIDMVPGYPGENGNMRMKEMEFRLSFKGAGRVFIPFANDKGGMGDVDRLAKAF